MKLSKIRFGEWEYLKEVYNCSCLSYKDGLMSIECIEMYEGVPPIK